MQVLKQGIACNKLMKFQQIDLNKLFSTLYILFTLNDFPLTLMRFSKFSAPTIAFLAF